MFLKNGSRIFFAEGLDRNSVGTARRANHLMHESGNRLRCSAFLILMDRSEQEIVRRIESTFRSQAIRSHIESPTRKSIWPRAQTSIASLRSLRPQFCRADWSRRRNPPLRRARWRVTASPPTRPTRLDPGYALETEVFSSRRKMR